MDISALLGGGSPTQANSAEQGKLPLEQNQDSSQSALFEALLSENSEVQSQDQKKAPVLSKDGKNEAVLKDASAGKIKTSAVAKNLAAAKAEQDGAEKGAGPVSTMSTPTFSAVKALAQEKSEAQKQASVKAQDYAEIDPRLKTRKSSSAVPVAETDMQAVLAAQAQAMAQAQSPVAAPAAQATKAQALRQPVVANPAVVAQQPVPQKTAANAQQASVASKAQLAKQLNATKAQQDLLLNPRGDQAQVSQLFEDPRLAGRQDTRQTTQPQAIRELAPSALQSQVVPQQTTTVVAQPIVIQMPMAIPVEVLSTESDIEDLLAAAEFSHAGPNAPTFASTLPRHLAQQSTAGFSQSAWNGLGAGLAVAASPATPVNVASLNHAITPNVREHLRAQKSLHSAEENTLYGNLRDQTQDMGLYMPQVLASAPRDVSLGSSLDFSKLGKAEGSRASLDVSNPTMVASYVGGLATQGGGTVKLKVVPHHLGEVTISVEGRGKNLNVRMDASSAEAKEVLSQSLPELRQALAANKYDIASIEINAHLSDRSNGAGQEQSQQRNQPGMAWERFFEQRDQSGQYFGGRREGAYRQYQQLWQEA